MFLQERIKIDSNGEWKFFGRVEFSLFPNADVGENWAFSQEGTDTVFASVVNIYPDSIFNIPDTFKVIALSSLDTILLSKNHGLISFPDQEYNFLYELVGIEGRDVGFLIPDFFDFFDFEVGLKYGFYGGGGAF